MKVKSHIFPVKAQAIHKQLAVAFVDWISRSPILAFYWPRDTCIQHLGWEVYFLVSRQQDRVRWWFLGDLQY